MAGRYRVSVATIAVLVLASLFILSGVLLSAAHLLTDWGEAQATVVASRTEQQRTTRPKGPDTYYDVRVASVRFLLPDGREVTASVRSDAAMGAKVRIHYDRNQPRDARLAGAGSALTAGLILLAFGALCLVIAHFVALRDGLVQRGGQ